MSSLKRFNYVDAVDSDSIGSFEQSIVESICEDGAVVVEDALTVDQVTSIVDEMRPFIDTTPHGLHGLAHSRRVGLTQIIDVGPGQEKQGVHRGNGLWVHDLAGDRLDPQIETMWALTDFTDENGATHVIPGSHRWPDVMEGGAHKGTRTWLGEVEDESVQATMRAGSVLIWTGWTVHGAGTNSSEERRVGMNIDYSLSFLSQEENQFLSCPPEVARTLSDDMRRLIGYTQGGGALNYFADCLRPKVALKEGYDVMVPGSHGMSINEMEGKTN